MHVIYVTVSVGRSHFGYCPRPTARDSPAELSALFSGYKEWVEKSVEVKLQSLCMLGLDWRSLKHDFYSYKFLLSQVKLNQAYTLHKLYKVVPPHFFDSLLIMALFNCVFSCKSTLFASFKYFFLEERYCERMQK